MTEHASLRELPRLAYWSRQLLSLADELQEESDTATFAAVLALVSDNHLGDLASVLGLIVAILGFAGTLWQTRKSRTASEQAKEAAESVREQLLQLSAVQALGDAIKGLEDIRRLHRLKYWSILVDQYTSVRKMLIAVRGRTPNLTGDQRTIIQSAVQHLAGIERQVERGIASTDEPAVDAVNQVVSEQIDRLYAVLVELQAQLDRVRQA